MRPRHSALLASAALLAATGSLCAPVARAASVPSRSTTICVGLVVDGRALGSDVSTSCAKVAKGATGIDVLQAAGHTIGFRRDGLICTIDGLPADGCAGVDDSHYWAYFHRAAGSATWAYSTEGAATYQPANGATEGWVYDDGTANTPKNVPQTTICPPATSSPSPSPTHPEHPTTHPKSTSSAPPTGNAATTTPSGSATSAPRTGGHHTPSPHAEPSSPTATPSSTHAPADPSASPSTTSAALAGSVTPAHPGHGGAGLILGMIVVLGLGALAIVRFRRSPR